MRGPASPVTASAINDGDVRTWWGGSAGASVTYSWLEAEAGATALAAGTSAHAVTELEFVPGPSGNVGGLVFYLFEEKPRPPFLSYAKASERSRGALESRAYFVTHTKRMIRRRKTKTHTHTKRRCFALS